MRTLSIDIETFSSINLAQSGVYRYAESPDFEILLFGYSADGSPVRVVDLASGEKLPQEIHKALTDPSVIKWAFNAQFERVCLSRYLGYSVGHYLDPVSWRCTIFTAHPKGNVPFFNPCLIICFPTPISFAACSGVSFLGCPLSSGSSIAPVNQSTETSRASAICFNLKALLTIMITKLYIIILGTARSILGVMDLIKAELTVITDIHIHLIPHLQ